MRTPLLIILTIFLSLNSFSQASMAKGYFIINDGQKTECFIKNNDWKNNPTSFEYRLTENAEKDRGTIKLVKEFGVYNYSKYIRSSVNIDRSSDKLSDLTADRNPSFKKEELFLKVLVEGESNLYQYEDGNLVRYFYNKKDSDNIDQLIFKSYISTAGLIKENSRFKQQLSNDLPCEQIQTKDIQKISYEKDDLIDIFVQYNQCNNSQIINFDEKQQRDLFNLTPRFGINSSSLSMKNSISSSNDVDFGNKIGFRLGIEAESILPFNNNKWAIIIEPTFQCFKSAKEVSSSTNEVDYSSLELPIGVRYYFFINDNSKLFINSSFILDIPMNSTIISDTGTELDISKSSNLGFGVGYKQNNRYSLELRYQTSRNVLSSYQLYTSNYNTVSVILGYSLF